MPLATLFSKPIDRPIEGVIKADDEANLRQEVEEYVLTNEVAKRLDEFLGAYNDYQGANGVWISGFFGSGKSHLLKMLALLFDDRRVDGTSVLELFLPKLGERTFLKGDLQRAVAVPSKSILFNIDQKADVISKTELDALLSVFVKVFDEMCGYYGKQGYIAEFERDLDSRDQYAAFQAAFRRRAGIPWEEGREQALLEGPNIDAAYAEATGLPVEVNNGIGGSILDKYRADYRVSIEDFAEQVDAYIKRQGPDFRLIFFVDEVGQYIADNVKLMTNLQTVAESLATESRGRAWIVVTAQEDMQQVFGDDGKQQTDDFSKIQARFKTRMKLTSADVEEVIRKRLLAKTERAADSLALLYDQHKNSLRTLFDFVDGSQTYRNFRDQRHFVASYPFVPYQFPLFQSAIQSLSQYNAFEGRHSSVGERSMLGVFQQVAIQISDHEIGQLATFDLMFEGIRTALKSQIQQAIVTAEHHLDDPFAVRLLKALFLVKYVKEFRATARNLTVLMIDAFDVDLQALQKRVQAALDLLEQQTYIQRTGEEYEYLTDEEKDIEQAIKQTDVDATIVIDELGRLIFDEILRDRKIRYAENGQDYAFSRKLDDRLLGREQELSIHVISPFHDLAGRHEVLRAHAMGKAELLVEMPLSSRLMQDLLMYKRTEKYTLQNVQTVQQASVRRILMDKQLQNTERRKALRGLVSDLLSEATLTVDARDLDINSGDPKTRIVRGFQELLARTYPNLRMLRGIDYTQQDVSRFLRPEMGLFGEHEATYSEAEQEVLAFVQANNRTGVRTTMQSVISRFEHKPYGWYLAAIQGTVAKLLGRGKLELNRDGTILEGEELERALTNTHGYGNVVLEPQIDFTTAQVRGLRDFYGAFFDQPTGITEAKALAQETAAALVALRDSIEELKAEATDYPFAEALQGPIDALDEVCHKPYPFYLTELRRHEDKLFEMKETVLDPVQRFMRGPQREIYDEARRFLESQDANFAYLDGDGPARLREILADPQVYRGNRMQEARQLVDELQAQVTARVAETREDILATLEARWAQVEATEEFAKLNNTEQEQLRYPFDELARVVRRQTLVAVMRESRRSFEETTMPSVLQRLTQWAAPPIDPETPTPGVKGREATEPEPTCKEPTPAYVTRASISVPFPKLWIDNEADVEAYVTALKEAMLQAIHEGKKIQI